MNPDYAMGLSMSTGSFLGARELLPRQRCSDTKVPCWVSHRGRGSEPKNMRTVALEVEKEGNGIFPDSLWGARHLCWPLEVSLAELFGASD